MVVKSVRGDKGPDAHGDWPEVAGYRVTVEAWHRPTGVTRLHYSASGRMCALDLVLSVGKLDITAVVRWLCFRSLSESRLVVPNVHR